MAGIWHVPFNGRGVSGHATQNFLWQDGPVYIMDNHRSAWWCWLRHLPAGESIDVFHIDRHTDTLGSNMPLWLAALPSQMRGVSIQSYLSFKATVNGFIGAAIRWDNYLSLFFEHERSNLGSIYFAPNSPPRAGLLKSLNSPDRHRALEGVKNAAWDITHLSDFIKKVNEANATDKRYLLASNDKALHIMAKFLFDFSADGIHWDQMVHGLSAWWSGKQAIAISERLARLIEEADSPSRALNNPQSDGFIDEMTARGERIVLSERAHPASR